ncbi:hypothetical protein PGB90_005279 [Kerria lacca]
MYETHVLFLMLKDDGYHKRLRMIYSDMHRGLKFEDFDYLDVLWHEYHHQYQTLYKQSKNSILKARKEFEVLKDEFKIWNEEVKEYFRMDPEYRIIPGEIKKVFDFSTDEKIENWAITSDQEMGKGYSNCTFTRSAAGHALFSGNLSTKVPNDGKTVRSGFCSIRAPRPLKSFQRKSTYDWTQYTHLVFKVRGDGRSYLINLGTEGYFDVNWYNMYSYGLFTRGGPYWQISKIPFSKFIFGSHGYIQDDQYPVSQDEITTFGITICDDIDGEFQLEIDYIGLEINGRHRELHAYEGYNMDKFMLSND